MDERSPLEADVRRRIRAAGPMPVADYMALCLTDRAHGYYVTRDPLGERGDFITAPEISQMFGELIGLWMAAVWKQMGAPANFCLVELGPGRGTMMKDALRAAQVMPGFLDAAMLHLVEISPALKARQQQTLQGLKNQQFWHDTLDAVPAGPAIIVANEFFDALPVSQAVKSAAGWHERRIGIGPDGNLAFTLVPEPISLFEKLLPPALRAAPDQSVFEWRNDAAAMQLGRRLAADGGAALVIDYGHAETSIGDTFQAVGRHAYADPLNAPGTVDLTAHVDFHALSRAVEAQGVNAFGPIEQSQFLRNLGIETRAAKLKVNASQHAAAEIDLTVARLIGHGRAAMGSLFKAAGFAHPKLGTLPGFA